MLKSNVSLWTNKWTEVYDFTPHKTADDGTPNWKINTALLNDPSEFIKPLQQMKALVYTLK